MKLVVKSRDLKWAGSRLFRGSQFEVTSERERPLADLLLKLGKVEVAKEAAPFRRVATTRALTPVEPEPEVIAAPIPARTADGFVDDSAAISPGRYRTRRLKAED